MKKLAIVLACMPACFILLTGCTGKKDGDSQVSNVSSTMEVQVTGGTDSTQEQTEEVTLPDGITYVPKDPENSGGIVVTPIE